MPANHTQDLKNVHWLLVEAYRTKALPLVQIFPLDHEPSAHQGQEEVCHEFEELRRLDRLVGVQRFQCSGEVLSTKIDRP